MPHNDNLSTPRGRTPSSGYDADAFARGAESIARFLGTGRYLATQTLFLCIWIALNIVGILGRWDPYPFILLNLAFSTQAAYAAPLILLAQNRQADRDKVEGERDRETNARSLSETEFLARELAAVRLMLEQKADRDDLVGPLEQLTQAIERLHRVGPHGLETEAANVLEADEGGYSADSSHQ
ncbi:MAG: DUF1003 domain-containing protein [Solirubrobacteraceae bacterium]